MEMRTLQELIADLSNESISAEERLHRVVFSRTALPYVVHLALLDFAEQELSQCQPIPQAMSFCSAADAVIAELRQALVQGVFLQLPLPETEVYHRFISALNDCGGQIQVARLHLSLWRDSGARLMEQLSLLMHAANWVHRVCDVYVVGSNSEMPAAKNILFSLNSSLPPGLREDLCIWLQLRLEALQGVRSRVLRLLELRAYVEGESILYERERLEEGLFL